MALWTHLHAGRRRFDDADRGPRPAGHVVASRLAGGGGRFRRRCWWHCCCARSPGTSSTRSPSVRRPVLPEMAEVATSGGPLAIAVCFGAYSCCWFAVVGFLPTLQVERLGFSTSTAAIVTAVVTIVNVAGNLAAGWLLQRGVPRVAMIVGAAVSMAVCAAGIFLDGVPDLLRLVLAGVYSAVIGVVPGCAVHRDPRPCAAAAARRRVDRAADAGLQLRRPARPADHRRAGFGRRLAGRRMADQRRARDRGGWPVSSCIGAKSVSSRA